jgi:hypothetical protein
MKHHGLPPDLERVVIGSLPITTDGVITGERIYLRGDHPEVVAYGTHVRLLPLGETLSDSQETVVEIEIRPLPTECYFG